MNSRITDNETQLLRIINTGLVRCEVSLIIYVAFAILYGLVVSRFFEYLCILGFTYSYYFVWFFFVIGIITLYVKTGQHFNVHKYIH